MILLVWQNLLYRARKIVCKTKKLPSNSVLKMQQFYKRYRNNFLIEKKTTRSLERMA